MTLRQPLMNWRIGSFTICCFADFSEKEEEEEEQAAFLCPAGEAITNKRTALTGSTPQRHICLSLFLSLGRVASSATAFQEWQPPAKKLQRLYLSSRARHTTRRRRRRILADRCGCAMCARPVACLVCNLNLSTTRAPKSSSNLPS